MTSFEELGISKWLVNVLKQKNITKPTKIQRKCIPESLNGKDIIGMSETGTGKTAAFALPILETLVKDLYGVFALVLTPTRELAFQIKEAFISFSGNFRIRTCLVIGGESIVTQVMNLDRRPHVVIATPGRLEEILRCYDNPNYFQKIKFLVFDEADRILDFRFSFDVKVILDNCCSEKQVLMFSATINDNVKKLAKIALEGKSNNLVICDACSLYTTVEELDQFYVFVPEFVKDCYVFHIVKILRKKKQTCIVFVSEMKECELLSQLFCLMGIPSASLHSTHLQKNRLGTLERFRNREFNCLFSTDVAARGLDIPDVSHVINFDIPDSVEKYVHRVGRTARAKAKGTSISLVSPSEVRRIKQIERHTKVKMKKYYVLDGEVERIVGDVAEKRCFAKLKLIENGFLERYQKRKEIIESSKKNEKKMKKYFLDLCRSREKKQKKQQTLGSKTKIEVVSMEKNSGEGVNFGGLSILKKRKRSSIEISRKKRKF